MKKKHMDWGTKINLVRQKRIKYESDHGNHDPLLCIVCKWRNAKDPQDKHRILDDAYQNKEDAAVKEIIFMGGDSRYIRARESPPEETIFYEELILHDNRELLKAIGSENIHVFDPSSVFLALSKINKGWLHQIQIASVIKSSKPWKLGHSYFGSCAGYVCSYMKNGVFPIVFTYLLECQNTRCIEIEEISNVLSDDFIRICYNNTVVGIPIWESIIKDADYYHKRDRRGLVFLLLCGYTHCPESPFYKDRLPRDLFKPIIHEAYLFLLRGELATMQK